MSEFSHHEQIKRIVTTKAHDYGFAVASLKAQGKIVEMLKQVESWEEYRSTLPRDLAVEATEAYREGFGTP